MNHRHLHPLHCSFLVVSTLLTLSQVSPQPISGGPSSIVFATWLRSSYSFDVYSLPTPSSSSPRSVDETRLTDGVSINYNGHFPTTSSVSNLPFLPSRGGAAVPRTHLIYVTERNGSSSVYLDAIQETPLQHSGARSIHQTATGIPRIVCGAHASESTRTQVHLVGEDESNGRISMKDRPSLVDGESTLVYVSTHEDPGRPRDSWTAVYSTHLTNGSTRRLSPRGVADYSPAVSPSGVWTAVASYGKSGWQGDIEELGTDIYVFLTRDGSNRVRVVEHGGWPAWADDSTLYFHRRGDDGWWGVYQATFNITAGQRPVVTTRRVTPSGMHAFTPAASAGKRMIIAVATRRPGSEYRHVEVYDVVSNRFVLSTRDVTPNAHHFNPFLSPDGAQVGYHRCRGTANALHSRDLVLENIRSPVENISLFQVDGSFPSYSPDGHRIAYVKLNTEPMAYVENPGLYVMNSDGSNIRTILTRSAFATAWDWRRRGVVYTSVGPIFAGERSSVDIVSVNVDDDGLPVTTLTQGGQNNAFPSPSPDGRWVVFRSGRSGNKNLYIMDAVNGERGSLRRLTEGAWTDTMCNWSPDGDWIAFSSDRRDPGSGTFDLYKIHPNGTGLEMLLRSGSGGRINHPWFSPDGQYIVVVADYAGVSAEPISNPHHFQPYGDVFVMRSDGSGVRRMTHNSYEDGTPAWGRRYVRPTNAEWPSDGTKCTLNDSPWLS